MRQFTRIHNVSTPIPFNLVDSGDHFSPALGVSINKYFVSKEGTDFEDGTGQIQEVGHGSYELVMGRDEQEPGTRLILISQAGVDPVYFRVYTADQIEIVPVIQDDVYIMMFAMISSSDNITPLIGASPQVTITRDGSSFVSAGVGVAIGRGFYKINTPTFAEDPKGFNNECVYLIKATATNADMTVDSFNVFRYHYPA